MTPKDRSVKAEIERVIAEMRAWDYQGGNPDSAVVDRWASLLSALIAEAPSREVGLLTVDIYFGPTEQHHLSGPLGLYPQGVAEIVSTVLGVLDRAEAATARLRTVVGDPASPRSAPATAQLQIEVCLCHVVTGGHLAINPQCPVHAKATAEEQK